jgi:hypothetical protein
MELLAYPKSRQRTLLVACGEKERSGAWHTAIEGFYCMLAEPLDKAKLFLANTNACPIMHGWPAAVQNVSGTLGKGGNLVKTTCRDTPQNPPAVLLPGIHPPHEFNGVLSEVFWIISQIV